MCGITGYAGKHKTDLTEAINSLLHRGPDDKGSFVSQKKNYNAGLGHTRLSIIDTSEKGHQPMASGDGQIQLVFNGEIYNYRELKDAYLSGEQFQSQTDTEVVLKMYQKFGLDFINYLNGDFAFAIADFNKEKLFLFRDRAGVKPLYYSVIEGQIYFASEIKALFKCGIEPIVNKELLSSYFAFKYTPEQNTLFKNVHRLKPGSFLTYDLNFQSLENKVYWEPSVKKEYQNLSYEEAKEEVKRLLEESVKMRLVSDVPVGTFLSGGLDSTIIASFLKGDNNIKHYCAQKSQKDLKKEGTTSDYYFAEKLARDWNLNFEALPISANKASEELIKKTVYYGDDLIADGSQIPSYLITEKASESAKVILTGMGADELFMGYAGHMISLLDMYLGKVPFHSSIASMLSGISQGKGFGKAYRRYLHKLGKYHSAASHKYGIYSMVGDFNNSLSVFEENSELPLQVLQKYFPEGEDPFQAMKKFEYENFLVKNLHYSDRMSMANSMEIRVPFLDHRIIELAWSLPRKYKLSNTGTSKKILKDAFKNDIPSYVTQRRKAGFGMPLRSIFSNRENINRLLDYDFLHGFSGFNMDNVEGIINRHISGKEDNSSIIYALISFEKWYKVHVGVH